jgi:nucleoside-diphosphate-sugar epimerase
MTGGRVVAVSGATGFLGAHVIVALSAAGCRIRVLTHRQPPHPLWRDVPVEGVHGTVTDADSCARLVAGVDTVIHAAGLIKALTDGDFQEINGQGAAIMVKAARDGGAGRFVLISSLAAREPSVSAYAASKRAGELAAVQVFSNCPERLVILRPPALYGPWDRPGLTFFKAAGGRAAPVFGNSRAAIMHVQDAANAIAQVAMGAPIAGCYALAGPDLAAYSTRELLQAAAQAVGGNPRLIPIPAAIVRAAGTLFGLTARLRGKPGILSAGKASEMLHPDWTVRPDEVLPFSVFKPVIPLDEGLRTTANWYRTVGWLPQRPEPPARITPGWRPPA